MSSTSGSSFRKPKSIWHKPIKVSFKAFFKALGNAGADAATGQWIGLGKDAVEIISTIGLEEDKPEELAWSLIYIALTNAVDELLSETHLPHTEIANRLDELSEQLDTTLSQQDLKVTERFFYQLAHLDVVGELQRELRPWFESVGLKAAQAGALSGRLPTYFVFALHREWQSDPDKYAPILARVDTPFAAACSQQHRWVLYNAWLQKQIEEPMVLSSLSLNDVYVPLRGYYKRVVSAHQTEKVAVDLARSLNDWIAKADPKDAVRVISGGPGSGKSSFAKIFAAHHANHSAFPVLFIPLHQLNFDQGTKFLECIKEFLRFTHIKETPLEPSNENMKLLIILDGLDELSFQGKQAHKTIQAFFKEVRQTVKRFNMHQARLQIIMTGREITVQDSFKEIGKILHTLPYIVSNKSEKQGAATPYVDIDYILKPDQRVSWWKKYGTATSTRYSVIPDRMLYPDLTEITSQPLLNYLVALSYLQGKLSLSSDKAANLNTVYADLLEAIYERDYDDQGKHSTVSEMSKQDFLHILEMIALSAWQGHKHSATISEIETLCHRHSTKQLLDVFQDNAIAGITQFLAAFYFRQSDIRGGERTFEFTHKSFREYLVARRIVSTIEEIQTELSSKTTHNSGKIEDALLRWAMICGPTEMDSYLLNFVRNELALRPIEQVCSLQAVAVHLIERTLQQGMPMEKLESSITFLTLSQWARNCEEALLCILNACAVITEKVSVIQWPHPDSFGTWLTHLQGHRNSENENITAFSSLSYLDLSNTVLDFKDLHGANLERSNLSSANLCCTNLDGANLRRANLTRTILNKASLDSACLDGANLDEANLENASLNAASLIQASLVETELHCASLIGAKLNDASLNRASFYCANLTDAVLRQSQLREATFKGAQLESAHLDRACLDETNLEGVCLDGASCVETHFRRARLDGASCEATSMTSADLSGAVLDGANFDNTSFLGANLDGASLELTSLQDARLVYASLRHATVDSANVSGANFKDIYWDEDTVFCTLTGLDRAIDIPTHLIEQDDA